MRAPKPLAVLPAQLKFRPLSQASRSSQPPGAESVRSSPRSPSPPYRFALPSVVRVAPFFSSAVPAPLRTVVALSSVVVVAVVPLVGQGVQTNVPARRRCSVQWERSQSQLAPPPL